MQSLPARMKTAGGFFTRSPPDPRERKLAGEGGSFDREAKLRWRALFKSTRLFRPIRDRQQRLILLRQAFRPAPHDNVTRPAPLRAVSQLEFSIDSGEPRCVREGCPAKNSCRAKASCRTVQPDRGVHDALLAGIERWQLNTRPWIAGTGAGLPGISQATSPWPPDIGGWIFSHGCGYLGPLAYALTVSGRTLTVRRPPRAIA
jgi:hypothetical protein